MAILVDLVKVGVIGASLAFLVLSYRLLAAESALKDAHGNPIPPRTEQLKAIKQFTSAALVFLIVGVFSEFMLSHGMEIANAATELAFGDRLVRVRFNEWEFDPKQDLIGFGFEENRVNTKSYVLPSLKDQYDVYVGIRKSTAAPFTHSDYHLLLGPYSLANQGRLEEKLTEPYKVLLGDQCVDFVAFGILRTSGKGAEIKAPFNPSALTHSEGSGICASFLKMAGAEAVHWKGLEVLL